MATFLNLFDAHVAELDTALPPEATPDQAAEAVRSFTRRLHDKWVSDVPPDESRAVAARSGVDILLSAADLIVSASRTEVWQQSGPLGLPGESRKKHFLWIRILLAVLALAMAGYLALVLLARQLWTELTLAGAVVAFEAARITFAFLASRKRRRTSQQAAAGMRTRATVHVDRSALLRRLSHAFAALDKQVEDVAHIRPVIASGGPVVEDEAFAELLQDLMEARETLDGEYALRVLRGLRSTLERHGIQVIAYDGSNRQLFEFQPSLQPGKPDHTLRPALVQKGRLMRRGLVAEAGNAQ